eukprot:8881850-Alexandrium_andersonii.AAC.1
MAQLSMMTDERNALRKLRSSAERDLNLANSKVAAYEAQISELVAQRNSEHERCQAQISSL